MSDKMRKLDPLERAIAAAQGGSMHAVARYVDGMTGGLSAPLTRPLRALGSERFGHALKGEMEDTGIVNDWGDPSADMFGNM
jgi:hypothetical protein